MYLYPLPEVETLHQVLGVPSISARFGTSAVWNGSMWLLARLAPKGLIADPEAVRCAPQAASPCRSVREAPDYRHLLDPQVKPLTGLVGPLVRAVDQLVGETVAMRVEIEVSGHEARSQGCLPAGSSHMPPHSPQFDNGKSSAGIYVHRSLSRAVGTCTAALARTLLQGGSQPGVWFPENREAVPNRREALLMASDGVARFELNVPVWSIEQEPKQLGFGLYM